MANLELVQLSLIFEERLKALNFAQFCTNKIFKIFAELGDCRETESTFIVIIGLDPIICTLQSFMGCRI